MTKTVFFDLGNVLLFFSHEKMFQQIADCCSLPLDIIKQSLIENGLNEKIEKGLIDSRGMYRHFCEISQKELEFSRLMHAVCNIFQPNEEMIPILKTLKENKIRLVLLSNTCEAHFDFAYYHYPFLRLFDKYVLSYQVNARKPDKEIFEKALAIGETSKQNVFYTDDIPEFIQAASNFGIDSEVFVSADALLEQLKQRNYLTP